MRSFHFLARSDLQPGCSRKHFSQTLEGLPRIYAHREEFFKELRGVLKSEEVVLTSV